MIKDYKAMFQTRIVFKLINTKRTDEKKKC